MNKSELIQALADKTGLTKVDTEKTLNALVETVIDTVADGQEVALIGLGPLRPPIGPQGKGGTRPLELLFRSKPACSPSSARALSSRTRSTASNRR